MDAAAFFDSQYKETAGKQELSDALTISKTFDPNHARLHYNSIERSIIKSLARIDFKSPNPSVLDIGSGSGHWIDFYQSCYGSTRSVGVDLSRYSIDALQKKYQNDGRVALVLADVSSADFSLDERFDIISAIGVMFHIVSDEKCIRALKTFSEHLKVGGVAIIGGQFGWITRDVFFLKRGDTVEVTKRIRSRKWWRTAVERTGLEVACFQKTKNERGVLFPENNILILRKPEK